MKKLKYEILFTILFMTIGIAAVTGNLLISGSTELAANTDDFDVYFSDVVGVNNVTGLTINTSKNFNFTTTLENLNQEAEISFKVTNASQNYDAEVSIDCTSQSVYLKATPYLSSNIVPAREEIDGSVSIKLVRQSIEYKSNQKITCTINASAVERSSLSTGIEYNEKLVMLKNYTTRDDTGFEEYKSDIKTITFQEGIEIHPEAIETWDFGVADNGNVMAFIIEGDSGYDLYIQSDEQLYGNPDMSYWFNEFYGLETINNLDLLDTSKVTNMYELFWRAENLQTVDLSSWDTSNVTSMYGMFDECFNLTTIIGLENLDVSNVTNMGAMFYMAQSIESINLSSFDTSKVTNMNSMFEECYSLTNVIGLENLDVSNVKNMYGMFAYSGITSLDLSNWDVSSWTSTNALFIYAENLQQVDLSGWDTSNVTNMSSMFEECSSLTTIIGLENFDTSNVTNMSSMFYYAQSIESINISNWDTSNVTVMSYMFAECYSLNIIIGLENLDTSNVTNMFGMFSNAESLESINLSNWDTSKVTDMNSMFYKAGYNNPDFNIDLSELDTSSVTNMINMFNYMGYNSTKLNTSITIRNPNITSYSYVFKNVANVSGTSFIVNYTSETESLVDAMIATKTSGANVVKGTLVE